MNTGTIHDDLKAQFGQLFSQDPKDREIHALKQQIKKLTEERDGLIKLKESLTQKMRDARDLLDGLGTLKLKK